MTSQPRPSAEDMMAYADLRLEGEMGDRIADMAENDPDVAAQIEALRSSAAAVSRAFDAPLHQPIPRKMLALLEHHPATASAKNSPFATLIAGVSALFGGGVAQGAAGIGGGVRIAGVATLTILAGFCGFGLAQYGSTPPSEPVYLAGVMPHDSPFGAALGEGLSARNVTLANDVTVRPVLTFAADDGRMCREFEIRSAAAASAGIACANSGGWQLETLAALTQPAANGGYQVASGRADAVLEDTYERLGMGLAFDAVQEQCAIDAAWSGAATACAE